MLVLQLRNKLKEHHKIYLSDDLPNVDSKHKDLYPVYIALRSLQYQHTDGFVKSVKLISDKLWLNGSSYTTEDLGCLLDNVSLDKLFNPCDKRITVFSGNSVSSPIISLVSLWSKVSVTPVWST